MVGMIIMEYVFENFIKDYVKRKFVLRKEMYLYFKENYLCL